MVSDFNRFSLKRSNDLVEFLKTLTGESPSVHLLSKPVKQTEPIPLNVEDK